MNPISEILIVIGLGLYIIPTIKIYNRLKKYDDKTPGFFMMHLKMRTCLKKYNRINKIQYGKKARLSKLWYFFFFCSISLIALAFIT